MPEPGTRDLGIMLSDPRKAVKGMAVPLFLGLLVSTVQIFVDTFWCTGLGQEAMASITVSGPVYWMMANVGIGLGVGVSAAVARALGAGDRSRADALATQIIVFSLVAALFMGSATAAVSEPLLVFMTGSDDVSLSLDYVRPYIVFSLPLVLYGILTGLLRGEGAARRVTVVSVTSCLVNIVLDPIMIYGLGWGVTGAALATCLTYCCTVAEMLFWYLTGRMYVRPRFSGYRPDWEKLRDVFSVGVPQAIQLAITPMMIAPQNAIVMATGGQAGLLCTTIPFNFVNLAMIPASAMSSASVSVASAAIGQRDLPKAEECFRYTMRASMVIAALLSAVLFVFSDLLVGIFTSTGDMVQYHDEFARVLRIFSCVTMLNSIIRVSSARMQAFRHANLSTVLMFLRECLFIGFYWAASFCGMGAIYWALVLVNLTSAAMMYGVSRKVTPRAVA